MNKNEFSVRTPGSGGLSVSAARPDRIAGAHLGIERWCVAEDQNSPHELAPGQRQSCYRDSTYALAAARMVSEIGIADKLRVLKLAVRARRGATRADYR
jgi:hypothetical protein